MSHFAYRRIYLYRMIQIYITILKKVVEEVIWGIKYRKRFQRFGAVTEFEFCTLASLLLI
jgi:hypothetical protein